MEIFSRILSLMKPYKISVFLLSLVAAIGVALQVSLPWFTKMIVDEVIKNNHTEKLLFYISGMTAVGAFYFIARIINIRLTALISARIVSDLRNTLHSVVQFLQLRFLTVGSREKLQAESCMTQGNFFSFSLKECHFY
jgi:ABC-type multidrug transport system fused ATPase/permease subunit